METPSHPDVPHDPAAPAPAPAALRRRRRRWLIAGAGLWVLALAALLRGTRGEAEARRNLCLRTTELLGWMNHEVATPCERPGFAEEGGIADAATAWREVLAAIEQAAALSLSGHARLPALAEDPRLAEALHAGTTARRFTAFRRTEELLEDPWLRRGRLFARLLADGFTEPADAPAWCFAALAFSSDLRSIATLPHGDVAAELEETLAQRLAALPLADDAATRLQALADAARRRLPPPECVAMRETRSLQITLCALADMPPLSGAGLRQEDELPLPPTLADDAVQRLDALPELLVPLLAGAVTPAALGEFAQWRDAFVRDLPRAAALLPCTDELLTTTGAAARVATIAERAQRSAGGPGPH